MIASSRGFMESTHNLLIVDVDTDLCALLTGWLENRKITVESVGTGRDALAAMAAHNYDLFLIDQALPDMDGLSLLEAIGHQAPGVPVVMMTGKASVDAVMAALKVGAYDYLIKPFESAQFINVVENAFEKCELEQENRRIAQRLKASERRYRYLIENSPDIIYVLDNEGNFTFINDAIERLLGYSRADLIGQPYARLIHNEDLGKAQWTFNERRTGQRATNNAELRLRINEFSNQYKTYDVKHLTIELKAVGVYSQTDRENQRKFIGTYGIARDISYKKFLESKLDQAQRLEAIGTLAGGIAHDFNNLLMGIQAYTSLLLHQNKDLEKPHYDKLKQIEQHVNSGAQLTRQLLGFAKAGKYDARPLNINDTVQRTTRMFGRTKKEIDLQTQLDPALWIVEADESQIKQVLLNLYVNAWQAMPEGGSLAICSENGKWRRPWQSVWGLSRVPMLKSPLKIPEPEWMKPLKRKFSTPSSPQRRAGMVPASV